MKKDGTLTQSMEMYLKTIAVIEDRGEPARVRDISAAMNVSMPSVTTALKSLAGRGLLAHDRYGYVTLTASGRKHARCMVHKCEMITRFLMEILGVDESDARADACLMEHVVSAGTLERLVRFMEFVRSDTRTGSTIGRAFRRFSKRGKSGKANDR